MINKCIIISQIITLLHVSKLSCHPEGAYNLYLAKWHKYFKISCWYYCKQFYKQLNLKYLCGFARYSLQALWGWYDIFGTCKSVMICEITVHLLVAVQNTLRKDNFERKNGPYFVFNLEVCDLAAYCVNWFVLTFLVLKVLFLLTQSDLADFRGKVNK
jgi:hypothetical protein